MAGEFSAKDKERIYQLVVKLVGTEKIAEEKAEIFLGNIRRRMLVNKVFTFDDYLKLTKTSSREFSYLISSLSIHSTYWFREKEHFTRLEGIIEKEFSGPNQHIRVLSAACSTGQEVYSIALVLEQLRAQYTILDYNIVGIDIDPISLEAGQKAIYDASKLHKIPEKHHRNVLQGSGPTAGKMTLSKAIRNRVKFSTHSILNLSKWDEKYDVIFCRNALIYFSSQQVNHIVKHLTDLLRPGGFLFLGHSETVDPEKFDLDFYGGSVFQSQEKRRSLESSEEVGVGAIEEADESKLAQTTYEVVSYPPTKQETPPQSSALPEEESTKPSVLVVDDSETILSMVSAILKDHFVITKARTCGEATKAVESQRFDLVTLDINLPDQSGLEWLAELRQRDKVTPVVLLTDASRESMSETLVAIEGDASEFFEKEILSRDQTEFLNSLLSIAGVVEEDDESEKRVLIVDDNSDIGEMICFVLEEAGYKCTFVSAPEQSLVLLKRYEFMCVVSDYRMPGMTGIELANRIAEFQPSTGVIMTTAFAVEMEQAEEKPPNIVTVLRKPYNIQELKELVSQLVKEQEMSPSALSELNERDLEPHVILIGTSTGGPQVLTRILSRLPANGPPIVVVQHIPSAYQDSFANRVRSNSGLEMVLVKGVHALERGKIYFSGGDYHLKVYETKRDGLMVAKHDMMPIFGHRPAVDPLFLSAAEGITRSRVSAFLLTGMGSDGAEGLLALKKCGHLTVVQERLSCVVFGMPKVALDKGAARFVMNPSTIREYIQSACNRYLNRKKVG